jgi:diketogulonate reductase-like aldo/keto reductase
LSNKIIEEIAHKYGKTPAQIVLRWHIQAGYIVIPGSENPLHIRENNDIYDLQLSEEEMARIAELNKNERFENW